MPQLFERPTEPQNQLLIATVLGLAADDAKGFALQRLESFYCETNDPEARRYIAVNLICLDGAGVRERVRRIRPDDREFVEPLLAELRSEANAFH